MDDSNPGSGPDEELGHWTTETLPMSVRKELLERELKKLGFRKAGSHGHDGGSAQQGHGGSGHPQADGEGGHGD